MDHIKEFEPFFGEWRAECRIGSGRFGDVYKGFRMESGKKVYSALKHISLPAESSELKPLIAEGMDDEAIAEHYAGLSRELSAELERLSALHGENIVSIEEYAIVPKSSGTGFDAFIRTGYYHSLPRKTGDKALSVKETVKLGADICSALEICAAHGVIHSDIKPNNIFVDVGGNYMLGDIGIARQLEKTDSYKRRKRTYKYAAPEVYRGEKAGPACDLYSLGLVMYRQLNGGRMPFMPKDSNEVSAVNRDLAIQMRLKGGDIPSPAGADEELSAIVLKACEYDPKERFASAADMKEALVNYSKGVRGTAKKPAQARNEVPAAAPKKENKKEQSGAKAPAKEVASFSRRNDPRDDDRRLPLWAVIAIAAAALAGIIALVINILFIRKVSLFVGSLRKNATNPECTADDIQKAKATSGWLMFVGILMAIAGVFSIISLPVSIAGGTHIFRLFSNQFGAVITGVGAAAYIVFAQWVKKFFVTQKQ